MTSITSATSLEIPLPIWDEGRGAGDGNRTRVLSLGRDASNSGRHTTFLMAGTPMCS